MGGTRILVGRYDGTQDAAALVNGLNDTAFGPLFTGDDPLEQAEAFLAWLSTDAVRAAAAEVFGEKWVAAVDLDKRADARRWPSSELGEIVAAWRGFYLDDAGDALLDERECACGPGHRHGAGDEGDDAGCVDPFCNCGAWAPGNRVAKRAAATADFDHLGIR